MGPRNLPDAAAGPPFAAASWCARKAGLLAGTPGIKPVGMLDRVGILCLRDASASLKMKQLYFSKQKKINLQNLLKTTAEPC